MHLLSDPSDGVSRAAMLADGSMVVGKPVADRRLVDWIQLGIVAAPEKRGLGRGKGIKSWWTAFDRSLWLDQLLKRKRGVTIQELCDEVIRHWAYSPAPITSAQIRRALQTWAEREASGRRSRLEIGALRFADRLSHPGAAASSKVRLMAALVNPKPDTPESAQRLEGMVNAVVLPHLRRDLQPSDNHEVANQLRVARAGRSIATRRSATEEDLRFVRRLVREATQKHAADRAARDMDRRFVAAGEPIGAERQMRAAADIVFALGALDLGRRGALTKSP